MSAQLQIAKYLKVSPNQIKRCEEWANVWFVVVHACRPTFISKKVIMNKRVATTPCELDEMCLIVKLEILASEDIESFKEKITDASNPFLPSICEYEIRTKSGRVLNFTNAQVIKTIVPKGAIEYIGESVDVNHAFKDKDFN